MTRMFGDFDHIFLEVYNETRWIRRRLSFCFRLFQVGSDMLEGSILEKNNSMTICSVQAMMHIVGVV